MKRFLSFITAFSMIVSSVGFSAHASVSYETAAAAAENAVINYNRSVPLEVKGNRLVERGTDNTVTLRGANVPSLGWGMAEHIYESMTELYDNWHANLIRLPIQPKYWFDTLTDEERKQGIASGEEYRNYVDNVVKAAQARGKYVILDCHTYVMPLQESLDLWEELAVKYGNNSAVLFGLLNEPHDIKPAGADAGRTAWDVWRNGGRITVNNEEVTGIGHQQLLEAIRAKGANNICIAGGLNWAFDISGLADGYDGLPNGYRLTDTAAGNGVMYDSHLYPVKGAKSAWDTIIGPVRKVAPILIGEWGWDSSDSAISGGDCTSNIWMNQLINWMDDEYDEYDGVPVNWAGWNLHMTSTPRMLYSWDFKTTAYNGTYIKNRLQTEPEPERFDGVYSADFSTDGVFRSYTGVKGKSTVTYSQENENVVIYHQPTVWNARLDFPYEWDLNGIQTITMDISADINETVDIGLYGSDEEAWTTPIDLTSDVKTITVNAAQLKKQGNPLTDGVLNGALSGIYFGAAAEKKGNITVDNIKIVKLAEPVYNAQEYPHTNTGAESYIDFDNIDFPKQKMNNGPGEGSYFKAQKETVIGADGNDTVAKHIEYDRINGPWGGYANFSLETVPSEDTKYFTVCVKGSGTAQRLGVSIGGLGSFDVSLEEGDTCWHQYIYSLEGNIEYPEDINYVQFSASQKIASDFYFDNVGFSEEMPERIVPDPEKTFVYDFATYKRNTKKFEAVITTEQGSINDTITAAKTEGGLDFETQALEITYNRNGARASRALVSYTSSDFFKGNIGDDARTENRKTLKADMAYMTDFVFYGKSTSGKNENINVGIIDAANGASTYTSAKEITLTTEWQQFRIPFKEFIVLDGGMPIEPGRVRGFVFSSASGSGEGSFMIDNLTHTNAANIEWSEPVPTPTADPTATSTPAPAATTAPTQIPPTDATPPVRGDSVTVVRTADEFIGLTAEDTTVRLEADIDLGDRGVKTKCPMYLDLNGYELKSDTSSVIEVSHNFTLTDTSEGREGRLVNTRAGNNYGLKCASGNRAVSIKDARVEATGQAIMLNAAGTYIDIDNAVINGGVYAINVGANGTLNIGNARVNQNEGYTGGALNVSGGTVRIDGGTFDYHGTASSITISGGSIVTINGGTFINPNKDKGAINNVKGFAGTLTINGGTFENTYNGNGYSILDGDEATTTAPMINITGGIFKSGIGATKPNNTTTKITISGGTFSFDPSKYVDRSKAEITENTEDGTFTVKAIEESEPADTPEPTDTPKPTESASLEPSDTPEPTESASPEPTDTPEPTESASPEPTDTPEPTESASPEPSDTPEPTESASPKPTDTPEPTESVSPEPTPTETATPEETQSPSDKYIYSIVRFDEDMISVEVTVPENASEEDTMYVAVYDDMGTLRTVYAVKDIEDANIFKTPEGASEVKVFIWDEAMKPLAEKKQD